MKELSHWYQYTYDMSFCAMTNVLILYTSLQAPVQLHTVSHGSPRLSEPRLKLVDPKSETPRHAVRCTHVQTQLSNLGPNSYSVTAATSHGCYDQAHKITPALEKSAGFEKIQDTFEETLIRCLLL